jgi:hypothetical protein
MTATAEDEKVERLSRALHWKMEHLDPSWDGNWDRLSERNREFYRQCVKHLLREMASYSDIDGS